LTYTYILHIVNFSVAVWVEHGAAMATNNIHCAGDHTFVLDHSNSLLITQLFRLICISK